MIGGEASGTEEKRKEGREREFKSKKEDWGKWWISWRGRVGGVGPGTEGRPGIIGLRVWGGHGGNTIDRSR